MRIQCSERFSSQPESVAGKKVGANEIQLDAGWVGEQEQAAGGVMGTGWI